MSSPSKFFVVVFSNFVHTIYKVSQAIAVEHLICTVHCLMVSFFPGYVLSSSPGMNRNIVFLLRNAHPATLSHTLRRWCLCGFIIQPCSGSPHIQSTLTITRHYLNRETKTLAFSTKHPWVSSHYLWAAQTRERRPLHEYTLVRTPTLMPSPLAWGGDYDGLQLV
jgi:hypothetical protein